MQYKLIGALFFFTCFGSAIAAEIIKPSDLIVARKIITPGKAYVGSRWLNGDCSFQLSVSGDGKSFSVSAKDDDAIDFNLNSGQNAEFLYNTFKYDAKRALHSFGVGIIQSNTYVEFRMDEFTGNDDQRMVHGQIVSVDANDDSKNKVVDCMFNP